MARSKAYCWFSTAFGTDSKAVIEDDSVELSCKCFMHLGLCSRIAESCNSGILDFGEHSAGFVVHEGSSFFEPKTFPSGRLRPPPRPTNRC